LLLKKCKWFYCILRGLLLFFSLLPANHKRIHAHCLNIHERRDQTMLRGNKLIWFMHYLPLNIHNKHLVFSLFVIYQYTCFNKFVHAKWLGSPLGSHGFQQKHTTLTAIALPSVQCLLLIRFHGSHVPFQYKSPRAKPRPEKGTGAQMSKLFIQRSENQLISIYVQIILWLGAYKRSCQEDYNYNL